MISILSIVGKYCYHAIFLYLCCPGLNRNVDNVNLFVDSFSLRESLTFNSKLPCLHRCHQTKKSARVILPIVRICSSLKSSCLNEKSGTDFSTYDSDDDVTRNEPSTEYQIFKGKNKWLGGAIDPKDGSIYGIPSNSNDVICLRPSRKWKTISSPSSSSSTLDSVEYRIHTIPLPKGINEGKFKWLRGIISNNFLYGIPAWSNNGILKLDIQKLWENHEERMENGHDLYDDVVSTIPLPESFYNHDEENKPSRWLWHGAALNSNKTAIYCIPSNAHQVLKVDLEQSVCSFLPIPEAPSSTPLDQTNKWYGGILGNDNAIYGIPYSAANVIRIDANTDTVSLLGDYGLNEYNWHGGIKSDINGCIYCFPAHHSHVLKINTDPKPNDEDDVDDVKKEFRLSLVPIHRASYDKDEVTRYKWLGGSLGADGNIYGMPSDASSILRIDTRRDVATTFGVVSGEKNKWQGGILSHDGKIYAIPSNAKHILYIDTSTNPCETTGGESDFSESETKYSLVGDLPGTKDKWQGGFVGIDNLIYCIPENFNKVMKVTPSEDPDNVEISFL